MTTTYRESYIDALLARCTDQAKIALFNYSNQVNHDVFYQACVWLTENIPTGTVTLSNVREVVGD